MYVKLSLLVLGALLAFPTDQSAAENDLEKAIATVRQVAAKGQGHEAAVDAMQELNKATAAQIPELLAGMDDANALAVNWLRSAIESAIDRGGEVPKDEIKKYLDDLARSHLGRAFAFELLTRDNSELRDSMLPSLVDDPSPPLRRQAVDAIVAKAKSANNPQMAIGAYAFALSRSRESDQIASIAKLLAEQGVQIDLSKQLGFVKSWQLVGPFDHVDEANFDNPLGPEKDIANIDLKAEYPGKSENVSWQAHDVADANGIVDLNKIMGKVKGAIVYAYAEFESEKAQEASIRIGCINGNKVWLNGQLVMSNEVYHNGMDPDQFMGKANLKEGKNTILIKVCQNEQKEPWAQEWQYQLRICDPTGQAILPKAKAATGPN